MDPRDLINNKITKRLLKSESWDLYDMPPPQDVTDAEDLLRSRSKGLELKNVKTGENGHLAWGTVICPDCKTRQRIACCSDVGSVNIKCENCGLVDL